MALVLLKNSKVQLRSLIASGIGGKASLVITEGFVSLAGITKRSSLWGWLTGLFG